MFFAVQKLTSSIISRLSINFMTRENKVFVTYFFRLFRE